VIREKRECHLDYKVRLVKDSDSQKFLEYLTKNKEHFRIWGPRYSDDYFSIDFIKKSLIGFITDPYKIRYIIEFEGKVIGDISYTNIIHGVFNSCNLGYRIDKNFEGKGIFSKALYKTLD
jgi:ribosomal-protein-alanine N-acetyltransferase